MKRVDYLSAVRWLLLLILAACLHGRAATFDAGVTDLALEDTKKLVVMIEGRMGASRKQGAGIIVAADLHQLLIVTADHVVREGDTGLADLRVRVYWSPRQALPASLLEQRITAIASPSNQLQDLAVLAVPLPESLNVDLDALPFDRIGNQPKRGDDVYFVGNPGQPWWTNVTPGKFAGVDGSVLRFESTVLHDGYSGGALINSDAEITGMVFEGNQLVGNALTIRAVIKRLAHWKLPVDLGTLKLPDRYTSIAAGFVHTCGLAASGFGYCWGGTPGVVAVEGGNANDKLGFWVSRIPGGVRYASIDVGSYHVCGIARTGEAYCLGDNTDGQLGNPQAHEFVSHPVKVSEGHKFRSISAGGAHTCAITESGSALCWGNLGAINLARTPVAFAKGLVFGSITSGHKFSCALTKEAHAFCWGISSAAGSLRQTIDFAPVAKLPQVTFAQISAGSDHACGVTETGSVYCWGDGTGSAAGNAKVDSDRHFVSVAAGHHFTCALDVEGRVYCWGEDQRGQLGRGGSTKAESAADTRGTPLPVASGMTFRSISAGKARYVCGVARDESVHCWGQMSRPYEKNFGDFGPTPRQVDVTSNRPR